MSAVLASRGDDLHHFRAAHDQGPDDDYDSLFVLRISATRARKSISFNHDQEGLTHLNPDCPQGAQARYFSKQITLRGGCDFACRVKFVVSLANRQAGASNRVVCGMA